jgi:ligand-binding sensor domain-containing protein
MKKIALLLSLFAALTALTAQSPNWLNFTCGKNINCIAEEGNLLWIGTNGGMVRLNKLTGETVFYNKANSGLTGLYVEDIAIDSQGNKWIAGGIGLTRFSGTAWTTFSPPGLDQWYGFNTIAIDSLDNIVADGIHIGLYKFDSNGNWTDYNTLFPDIPFTYTCNLFVDNQQNLWVGTWNNLLKYNGSYWYVSENSYSILDSVNVYFNHMTLDNQGNVWTSCFHDGLVKYNGSSWHCYQFDPSISSGDFATSLFCDSQNNIWIGTWHGQLAKFDGSSWTVYTNGATPAFDNEISCLFVDKSNSLWFGSDGLYNRLGTDIIAYNTSNSGLQSEHVYDIGFDNQ